MNALKDARLWAGGGLLSVVVLAWAGWSVATAPTGTPVNEAIDPKQVPVQEDIPEAEAKVFQLEAGGKTWTVTPKARYRVAARVLSTERYSSGWESDLSPIDFALGWGDLSDPAVDEWIEWSQSTRWYFYRWKGGSPYQKEYIIPHSANTHIIPATDNLRRAALRAVDEDDVVLLEGVLVFIEGGAGGESYWWRSSLSREDSGQRSCEVFYVERLVVGGIEYR